MLLDLFNASAVAELHVILLLMSCSTLFDALASCDNMVVLLTRSSW